MRRTLGMLAFVATGTMAMAGAQAVTPFQQDVAQAINNGLTMLTTGGAFNNPSAAGDAAGLTTLALLEKRPSGNPSDPPQGYNGADGTGSPDNDKARLRRSVAYMAHAWATTGFYAYRDGSALAALTKYLLTGGPETCGAAPNPHACPGTTPVELQNINYSLLQIVNNMVDRTLAAQRNIANGYVTGTPSWDQGYWCYTNGGCRDSSTTQFAALGLSAVQALYNNPAFGDPGARLPKIHDALALARLAYEQNAAQGSEDAHCDAGYTTLYPYSTGAPTDLAAYGHGYHSSHEAYAPSLQQTASGLFVQVLGGSDINQSMVQGYMRWIYDHYRYSDIGSVNGALDLYNSWPSMYFYYLWSSFKGIEFMIDQGIAPAAGHLSTASYGTLDGSVAPVCTDRQKHRDPTKVVQVTQFGAGGAGTYSAETPSMYFDYAYSLLAYQCPNGSGAPGSFISCNSDARSGDQTHAPAIPFTNPGGYEFWSSNAFALLVLQRATGVVLPTATLTASAASAPAGSSVTLTWGSQNANSCAASTGHAGDGWTGSSLGTSGSLPVKETTAGTYTYTITCSAGNQSAQATAQVTFTAAGMCDISGPHGVPDGEVSQYDITAIQKLVGQKVQPNGPAPAAADPMHAGTVTAQDVRACILRCTHASCAY